MIKAKFRDTVDNLIDSPSEFFHFKNCIVDMKTGLIFDPLSKSILWQAANEQLIWMPNAIYRDDRFFGNNQKKLQLIIDRMNNLEVYMNGVLSANSNLMRVDTALHLLHPFSHYAFGHFFDSMQKIYVAEKFNLQYDSVLFSRNYEIKDFDDHIRALRLSDKKHYFFANESLLKVDNLFYIRPVAKVTSFTQESFDFIRNCYYDYFNISSESLPEKKIFLTRKRGKQSRFLLNDKLVEEELIRQGVRVLDGSESLRDIVNLMANASHVAGIHGSLFLNNIYANNLTKFKEYCPVKRPCTNFEIQYKASPHYDFKLIKCDDDFNVELDILELQEFYAS